MPINGRMASPRRPSVRGTVCAAPTSHQARRQRGLPLPCEAAHTAGVPVFVIPVPPSAGQEAPGRTVGTGAGDGEEGARSVGMGRGSGTVAESAAGDSGRGSTGRPSGVAPGRWVGPAWPGADGLGPAGQSAVAVAVRARSPAAQTPRTPATITAAAPAEKASAARRILDGAARWRPGSGRSSSGSSCTMRRPPGVPDDPLGAGQEMTAPPRTSRAHGGRLGEPSVTRPPHIRHRRHPLQGCAAPQSFFARGTSAAEPRRDGGPRSLVGVSTASAPTVVLGAHFARDLPEMALPWRAEQPPEPRLLVLNEPLAGELGLDPSWLRSDEGIGLLTGASVPDGATPVAQAYAGHQFGGYAPRLGDGRALLLGELPDVDGRLRDLHLKGSGRTPFARGADGLAAVGPMLREYVVSEAMHALGIPTTRSLAVVATGRQVRRETLLPGAVLTRVGSFQYARATGDVDLLRRVADHAVSRHHPAAADAELPALALFEAVVTAQAELVARWMLVGFVHGVMNTDNMTISGETIDFGPCAFMEAYDPATVY